MHGTLRIDNAAGKRTKTRKQAHPSVFSQLVVCAVDASLTGLCIVHLLTATTSARALGSLMYAYARDDELVSVRARSISVENSSLCEFVLTPCTEKCVPGTTLSVHSLRPCDPILYPVNADRSIRAARLCDRAPASRLDRPGHQGAFRLH